MSEEREHVRLPLGYLNVFVDDQLSVVLSLWRIEPEKLCKSRQVGLSYFALAAKQLLPLSHIVEVPFFAVFDFDAVESKLIFAYEVVVLIDPEI